MSHEQRCLDKYFGDDCHIITTSTNIDHDGYDSFGPESNLYDFAVLFLKDGKIYYSEFHREYWFHGEDDEEYGLVNNDMFNRCISDELKDMGYFTPKDIQLLNSILNEQFTELVVDNIINQTVKNSYLPELLSFDEAENNSEIMKLDNYGGFSLYLKC